MDDKNKGWIRKALENIGCILFMSVIILVSLSPVMIIVLIAFSLPNFEPAAWVLIVNIIVALGFYIGWR